MTTLHNDILPGGVESRNDRQLDGVCGVSCERNLGAARFCKFTEAFSIVVGPWGNDREKLFKMPDACDHCSHRTRGNDRVWFNSTPSRYVEVLRW